MTDLLNNPTTTGIATGAALGAFAGGSYAMLTGHDENIERYAARWSVYGGFVGLALEVSVHIGRAIAGWAAVRWPA